MCETTAADPLAPADHNEAYDATWDFQIGELLNAQVHTAAWVSTATVYPSHLATRSSDADGCCRQSGLGMYHNCCGGNTTMPSIFSRTLATVNKDNTWQWSDWVPDAL